MQIFISAFLIITQNWKQCECPSAGKWANNSSIYKSTTIFYSKKTKKQTYQYTHQHTKITDDVEVVLGWS